MLGRQPYLFETRIMATRINRLSSMPGPGKDNHFLCFKRLPWKAIITNAITSTGARSEWRTHGPSRTISITGINDPMMINL